MVITGYDEIREMIKELKEERNSRTGVIKNGS